MRRVTISRQHDDGERKAASSSARPSDDRVIDPDQYALIGFLLRGMCPRMKSIIRTGTSVTDRSGDDHREGLGERQRLEEPPFLRLEREHRQERHGDDQQREEERRPDLPARGDVASEPRLLRASALEVLVGVLDHHDRGIDHGADRDRDAAQAHDVGGEPEALHRDEREQHADRQVRMATRALRAWSRNTMQTSATMTLSSISVWRRVSIARRSGRNGRRWGRVSRPRAGRRISSISP